MRGDVSLKKGLITMLVLSSISGNVYASEIPQQVYDNLSILEDANYISHKDVSNYDRKELAKYIAGILEKQPTGFDAVLSSRIIEDEAQLILIREQENGAKKKMGTLLKDYKKVSEDLFRKSIQGENRLEVMEPLKQRHDELRKRYQESCSEYLQAQARTKRLETMIEALKKRQYNDRVDFALADLRAEFVHELNDLNYFDDEAAKRQLYSNAPVRNPIEQKFKLDGQVQLSNADHHGDDVPQDQFKLKVNLYGDYNFDNNWHFLTNFQAEKVLHPSNDWELEAKNYYIEGRVTPGMCVDVGKFNAKLAEGNVFDGAIKGAALFDKNYRVEHGTYEDSQITGLTYKYDNLSAGYYHASKPDKSVYMLNGHLPIDKHLDFGGMFLKGKNDNGYVLSINYNQNIWDPKTSKLWLKYYHQPADTYFKHEMNGLADYMLPKDGFKGWGLGYNYLLNDSWTLGLEYYRLNNLLDNRSSNTFFAYLTYSFKNYTNE